MAGMDRRARVAVALKASPTVGVLLVGALFCGKAILYLFGIEIATFTVAGGLVILFSHPAGGHSGHGYRPSNGAAETFPAWK